MPNLTDEQHRFVEDLGHQMLGWGLPRNTGRIWAYLLMRGEPTSLDEISAGIEVGKSSVSVGTRQLVQFGLAGGEDGVEAVEGLVEQAPAAALADRSSQAELDQLAGPHAHAALPDSDAGRDVVQARRRPAEEEVRPDPPRVPGQAPAHHLVAQILDEAVLVLR